jgi:hypothetical protein
LLGWVKRRFRETLEMNCFYLMKKQREGEGGREVGGIVRKRRILGKGLLL